MWPHMGVVENNYQTWNSLLDLSHHGFHLQAIWSHSLCLICANSCKRSQEKNESRLKSQNMDDFPESCGHLAPAGFRQVFSSWERDAQGSCCCNSIRENGWNMREANRCINTLTSPSTIQLPLLFMAKVMKSALHGSFQHCGMKAQTFTKSSTGPFPLGEIQGSDFGRARECLRAKTLPGSVLSLVSVGKEVQVDWENGQGWVTWELLLVLLHTDLQPGGVLTSATTREAWRSHEKSDELFSYSEIDTKKF